MNNRTNDREIEYARLGVRFLFGVRLALDLSSDHVLADVIGLLEVEELPDLRRALGGRGAWGGCCR